MRWARFEHNNAVSYGAVEGDVSGGTLEDHLLHAAVLKDLEADHDLALFVERRPGDLLGFDDHGQGQTLRQLARGAVVGELALLTSEPRSASVRAARATDLITIDREDLDAIMERHPEVARAMLRRLAADLLSDLPD